MFWPGKKQVLRAAQDPTTATLRPAKDESKDWDTTNNIFIEGDNLEVLKVLQKQYHNSIKMIYIDPPYNTGKDFVYPDNFKEGLQNYLEFSQQVDEGNKKISTNTETAGRYHELKCVTATSVCLEKNYKFCDYEIGRASCRERV